MEKKRPIGVTLLGIIMLIYSILIICGLPIIFSLYLTSRHKLYQLPLLALYLNGLIYLFASINILRLKNWGRLFGVYASGFSALLSFWKIMEITGGFFPFLTRLTKQAYEVYPGSTFPFIFPEVGLIKFCTLPSLLFLLFLITPKVKKQFK